jgi:hypothetical protein
MVSSGMLRHVALVRTDVTEEPRASFIRVTRIGELRRTLAATRSVRRLLVTAIVVPSSLILVILMKEVLGSSVTSVLTRATWRNIPEDPNLLTSKFLHYSVTRVTQTGNLTDDMLHNQKTNTITACRTF